MIRFLINEVAELHQRNTYLEEQRNMLADHLAEIKATDDGKSDQPISVIIEHCIAEINKGETK